MNEPTKQPRTMNKTKIITMLLCGSLIFAACKKNDDDPAPPVVNEEEVITTMILQFDDQGAGADREWRFTDADGDGGNPPVIHTDTLIAGATYDVDLILLNETQSPADTVSNEVLDEATQHQFFFQPSGVNVAFSYADADTDGNPIGLQTTCVAGAASSGTVLVTLRHQPDKFAAGVSGGDITNAGGETDIEVSFPAVVQ